jgi:prevent-host-death family protein
MIFMSVDGERAPVHLSYSTLLDQPRSVEAPKRNIAIGSPWSSKQIPISKFKATCLAVLDRVRQTREPVLVTKRGKPIAEIKPQAGAWLGALAGLAKIVGDIVASAEPEDAWEALR